VRLVLVRRRERVEEAAWRRGRGNFTERVCAESVEAEKERERERGRKDVSSREERE